MLANNYIAVYKTCRFCESQLITLWSSGLPWLPLSSPCLAIRQIPVIRVTATPNKERNRFTWHYGEVQEAHFVQTTYPVKKHYIQLKLTWNVVCLFSSFQTRRQAQWQAQSAERPVPLHIPHPVWHHSLEVLQLSEAHSPPPKWPQSQTCGTLVYLQVLQEDSPVHLDWIWYMLLQEVWCS